MGVGISSRRGISQGFVALKGGITHRRRRRRAETITSLLEITRHGSTATVGAKPLTALDPLKTWSVHCEAFTREFVRTWSGPIVVDSSVVVVVVVVMVGIRQGGSRCMGGPCRCSQTESNSHNGCRPCSRWISYLLWSTALAWILADLAKALLISFLLRLCNANRIQLGDGIDSDLYWSSSSPLGPEKFCWFRIAEIAVNRKKLPSFPRIKQRFLLFALQTASVNNLLRRRHPSRHCYVLSKPSRVLQQRKDQCCGCCSGARFVCFTGPKFRVRLSALAQEQRIKCLKRM